VVGELAAREPAGAVGRGSLQEQRAVSYMQLCMGAHRCMGAAAVSNDAQLIDGEEHESC
jgi:hypothetical protein